MNKKTLWITETAVMIALLVALQWATKPLGQFVTGSCVNLVLGVSALVGGLWCGLTVALVSPFFAFLLGIGPAFLPIVPMVAVGNMVLVVILHLLASRDKIAVRSYLAVAVGAVTKFLALWLLIVKLVLPTLGLAEKQGAAICFAVGFNDVVSENAITLTFCLKIRDYDDRAFLRIEEIGSALWSNYPFYPVFLYEYLY